ncbi:HAD-IB family phosphatase [Stetteria hydrogenophila]
MAGVRIVFMDVDGVLTLERSSWGYVHEALGVGEEARRHVRDFIEGRIDYVEWMRRDTQLWVKASGGRLHRSMLERIVSGIPIDGEARGLVSWLRGRGVRVVLVSAGVELLVERVAREVGADAWVAPRLAFDEEGYLVPGGVPVVTPTGPQGKGAVVRRLASMHGVSVEETAFIGDSEWDREAFEAVGHPIAYKPESPRILEWVECAAFSMRGLRRSLEDLLHRGACARRVYR